MDSSKSVPIEVIDPARLASLRATGLLDSPPEKAFDDLTELVGRLLDTPVSLVSLVDSDRQFFKSSCGLGEPWASKRETPLSHSFCKHVVAANEPLIVPDARQHAVVRKNLAIRDLGVIAYLGVPLCTPDGNVIGSLCAVDGNAREWSDEHLSTLSVLAEAVMNEIAVRLHVEEIESYTQKLLTSHDALERYASELKVANATKDKFFSIVAHDLRGPLQSFVGYSEALVEETAVAPNATVADLAERLHAASGNMVCLVENLLEWARVQNGGLKCDPQPLEVHGIVRAAMDAVEQQANWKGIRIEVSASGTCEVFADPHMVASVLQNLLTNSIKFTPAGGRITISITDRGDAVEVCVEDDGVGMDEEVVLSLFDAGGPGSRRGTEGEKGTGLGLTLCREFVELNGGSIWAESSEGVGTRVSFSLPQQEGAERRLVA